MTTRVYRFGLLPPTEGAETVKTQMRLNHRFRNDLVRIEIERRRALRSLMSAQVQIHDLEVAAALAGEKLHAAIASARAEKSQTRKARASAGQLDSVKVARQECKEISLKLREARKALREDARVAAEVERINELASDLRKNASHYSGVYWGTKQLAQMADDASRKDMPLWWKGQPNDPRFERWEGEGALGIQVQNGMSLDDCTDSTLLRIEPGRAPKGADPKSKRSAKRAYATLALRVSSAEKGAPVWARWPMVMHRQIPEGAKIKRAAVKLNVIGPRPEWYVIITVDLPDDFLTEKPSGRAEAVGVDLGWRALDNGLRIAAWKGSDGRSGQVVLSERELGQMTKAESLRSIRDRSFNEARAKFLTFGAIPRPEWFEKETRTISQWHSVDRLAKLVQKWKSNRFDGDEEFFAVMEAWRYHDFHLWTWECSQRRKALRHRREVYRMFAAKLSREYARLIIEDFDISDVAKHPNVEDEKASDNENARSQRFKASASEFRGVLTHAFDARGGTWEKVPARNTTKDCSACGSTQIWNQAKELVHKCSNCGVTWDQDDNAAENILAARAKDAPVPVPRALKEHRWDKRKRMAAEAVNV